MIQEGQVAEVVATPVVVSRIVPIITSVRITILGVMTKMREVAK